MWSYCLRTDILSPHQLPIATEIVKRINESRFRYIAVAKDQPNRGRLGWGTSPVPSWALKPACRREDVQEAAYWSETADVLLCSFRDFDLFEKRCRAKKLTFYMSERWFKPPLGRLRLLHPSYFEMAVRFVRLLRSPYLYYLPIGDYAVRDMHWLVSFLGPRFTRRVSPILIKNFFLWGYFVGAGDCNEQLTINNQQTKQVIDELKILWFGRLLKWKRVDTLLHAVSMLAPLPGPPIKLKIIGIGPERNRLQKKARCYGIDSLLEFTPAVPIQKIRLEIRDANVCVVTSNAQEGWSVAVNEGLIEGRCVVASNATGASVTLIQDGVNGLLFKSGDADDLTRQLQRVRSDFKLRQRLACAAKTSMLAEWSPAVAAERLLMLSQAFFEGTQQPQWLNGPLKEV